MNFRNNIYLDVDGVILTKGVMPALHLDKFLRHILSKYSVFWLTPRCHGDTKNVVRYVSQFFPPETLGLLKKIKPTSFDLDKTEAIDFSKKFFWLDCELFVSEANTLSARGKYNSWIEMNLMQNPDQLLNLVNGKLSYHK